MWLKINPCFFANMKHNKNLIEKTIMIENSLFLYLKENKLKETNHDIKKNSHMKMVSTFCPYLLCSTHYPILFSSINRLFNFIHRTIHSSNGSFVLHRILLYLRGQVHICCNRCLLWCVWFVLICNCSICNSFFNHSFKHHFSTTKRQSVLI